MNEALGMLCRKKDVSQNDALVQYFVEKQHQIPKIGIRQEVP